MGKPLTQCEKIIVVNGCLIAGIEHHATVEDNKFLQRMAKTECAESGIVLKLLAYEKETYLSVINNILRLSRRTGSIQRYGHQTIGKSRKISK